MARKWEKAGQPNAEGLSQVTARQKIGEDANGRNLYQDITYGVYGVVKVSENVYTLGKDAGKLWLAALNKRSDAEVLSEYERAVYGLDLETRQAEKPDADVAPRAAIGKEEIVDLVTGEVFAKKTGEKVPGRTETLEGRVEYINSILGVAKASRKDAPKAFSIAQKALEDAGLVKMDAGRLVIIRNGGKAPVTPAKK